MKSTGMINDFPDWMSPMLVKELRQGMRSRAFVWAFFLTQFLMVVSISFSLAATDTQGWVVHVFDGLFWVLIGVSLLLIMPVRAFGSIGREIRDCTLDLILLTHLSAWRVLIGKWIALVAQTLLLVCSILPYVVLRYFLGGVNLLDDLQIVLFLTLSSAALTAVALALSPFQSKILRAVFMVGFIFVLQASPFVIGMIMAGAAGPLTGSLSITSWQFYLMLLLYYPAFILFSLQSGAGRIAPPAENHDLFKRVVGLLFLLIAPLLIGLGIDPERVFVLTILCLVPLVSDALVEESPRVPAMYTNLMQGAWFKRLTALIFLPGWPFALIYILILALGITILSVFLHGQIKLLPLLLPALGATLLLPAALIRLVAPKTTYLLVLYIGIQLFFVMMTFFLSIIADTGSGIARTLLSMLPMSVLLSSINNTIPTDFLNFAHHAMLWCLGLSYVILIIVAIRPAREIYRLWRDYQLS